MKIGSLFTGYGGLDMAVADTLGGETAWVSDIDKGACKILAHRYPDAPNLGDITTVDWSQVEPVDVLTGGFPCQDVSHAGKRAGIRPGTRSGLWEHFAYAIDQLRPSLVVIENVRGLLSASAHSDLEPCPWCLGDEPDGHLRALGAVLGGLADIGYDAEWVGLPASGVGAPHGRFRVFIAAHPRGKTLRFGAGLCEGRTRRVGWGRPDDHHLSAGDRPTQVTLFPTPRATDGTKGGPNQRGSSGDLMLPSAVMLLPTPAVNDMGEGKTVEVDREDEGRARQRQRPRGEWGDYASAIARWEAITRPAPAPTELGPKGSPRLSPRFTEWMMGLPDGWITDVPGITRNEALKACGNGVVPQQAAEALRWLLAAEAVA